MSDFLQTLLEHKTVIAGIAFTFTLGSVFAMILEWLQIKEIKEQLRARSREHKLHKTESNLEKEAPSVNAILILHLLLNDDEAEALSGDLHERYAKKSIRLGKRRADVWLWSQVLRSIWPLLKRFFAAGGFLAAAELIRKLLS